MDRRLTVKRINLALQGGGAHGAFTWGVLDAFLEGGRLELAGISGTSAGAMNAAVLADGLRQGGAEAARERLRHFWRSTSYDGDFSGVQRKALHAWLGFLQPFAPTRAFFAPAQFNPFDINELRSVVAREIDFPALRESDGAKLFISATNVWTGKVRVFQRHELTIEMLMASACLPTVFQAVEVEGQPYWDGGYSGNPALFPFFYQTDCDDIVLVQINPIERRDTPDTAVEIASRVDEITFNSSLLHEFRAIDLVARLIDEGRLDGANYRKIRVHRVDGGAYLRPFGASSKMKAEWDFFEELFALGREAGHAFLAETCDAIGVTGTLDLRKEFT